ncbi:MULTISPECIES: tRNA (N6-threonylcarbamoyladenosine(37)-N6)-methyltransferase TrmO [unclassified Acinetobacter]|uniref:tRNA (N6-threonylcarbamoyladenosine(37)-N6)-methyltransferase TrmO n=1 Tax=unclassified Acinetobacter TaxID=196816 RepID=UPI002934EDA5|nr:MULTISPECIES: tRNA (N6-threonylcarbamoyladenosine(37)-N6)-methyltransferase TrmO [unclassified Acinetobacter]WOE32381.1 tRNA (N6-threonylcarbamoyladenosine(37)-N6)-methyltransferase TrmO [Acinetobacter sp. SAAs470]WOE37854.1 tRNA (N6-threonylcarbamoyladenosine(37)-N6)-methyltransferase TrmO [Acinetobacter sp. SAAs474]
MMNVVNLPIIGYMHTPYREKFGIPRQPNLVDIESYIEMTAPYDDMLAFEGISEFSHLWLIWQFHDNKSQKDTGFRPQVRPPRLGGNKKIGVFATRSMYRPSPIGLSVVQLKAVKKIGNRLRVYLSGSDLLHGTPILDIKPYIQYSDAVIDAQSAYAQQEPLRKQVLWQQDAIADRQLLLQQQQINLREVDEIEQILSLDPKPAYQHDPERIYGMRFANVNIQFKSTLTTIQVVALTHIIS